MKLKRLSIAAVTALATVAAIDVGLTLFALDDGVFMGREVPPFSDASQPRWRFWLRSQRLKIEGTEQERPAPEPDTELGWTNRPMVLDRHGNVAFNSIGARGSREYPPLPAPGDLRMALFGESFTYCEEVDDPDAFEAQLEALDPHLEAINFGVDGYGTDQALMRFRRDGTKLGARVLALGLMLENIGRNVNRLPRLWNPWLKGFSAKPRFLLQGGELVVLPNPITSRTEMLAAAEDGSLPERLREHEAWAEPPLSSILWRSSLYRLWRGQQGAAQRFHPRLWADRDGEPYRVTLAILEAFHREAKAAGAEHAVILIFPVKEDLERFAAGGARYWKTLTDELDARGIEYLDLASVLGDAVRADPSRRLFLRAHLNRDGNSIVAHALEDWIRRVIDAK